MKIRSAILSCTMPLLATVVLAGQPALDPSWTWTETPYGKPVIDRGAAGSWEHYAVDNPYVFSEAGTYYSFYEAQDKPLSKGGHERFGLAVSRDGLHWSKSKSNPILDVGPQGAWDDVVAKLPAGVIHRDGTYFLFYSGRDGTTKQIGVATAGRLDGKWTRSAQNPVLRSRPTAWDRHISTYPSPVFQRDGRYHLLFRGMQGFYRGQGPGLAVSDDLLGWRKGPQVRFRASVAAETLSNPFLVDGQWNVLYEQKDRIYRAVLGRP